MGQNKEFKDITFSLREIWLLACTIFKIKWKITLIWNENETKRNETKRNDIFQTLPEFSEMLRNIGVSISPK